MIPPSNVMGATPPQTHRQTSPSDIHSTFIVAQFTPSHSSKQFSHPKLRQFSVRQSITGHPPFIPTRRHCGGAIGIGTAIVQVDTIATRTIVLTIVIVSFCRLAAESRGGEGHFIEGQGMGLGGYTG